MVLRWSSRVLDDNVAPGLSTFTSANIPDLSDASAEAPHWLANYFLNSVFRSRFDGPWRQGSLAYLRRIQHALGSYAEARSRTMAYLTAVDPTNPPIRQYYASVDSWEDTVLQLSMAIDIFNWLGRTKLFKQGEGTVLERIYQMGNHVKHIGSCLDSGQCTDRDSLPLWLSNHGLNSFAIAVTYADLADVMKELVSMADKLQDPATFREKLTADITAELADKQEGAGPA